MEFHAENFSLDNAPWSGISVEVDSDQSEKWLENNQHYTMREIANTPKISKSNTENHLHQFGYVNHYYVWIKLKWKKTFLMTFPHMIVYLNVIKHLIFKINFDRQWKVDTVQ